MQNSTHQFISALIFALLVSMLWLPRAASADQNTPAADELQQKAQRAYIEHRFEDAAALDAEIAQNLPDCPARRYAVMMLGNIYEENIVDLEGDPMGPRLP